MDPNDASLTCAVNIEWNNSQGTTMRKFANKQATLRLTRNALKEMFLEITAEKHHPMQLKLRSFTVHSKFMVEGKASVKFNDEKCTLFLSNAPPGPLAQFLKVIYVKVTNGNGGNGGAPPSKEELLKKSRAKMLAGKPINQFDDISPVTTNELVKARKLALGTGSVTTPSPPLKRKRLSGDSANDRPAAKKLYSSYEDSSAEMTEQKLNEQQKRILDACQTGRSVFFTGSAGTGKSFLLRKIIATLPPDGTVATASTGVAACLIGGTTLHSFAGIGSGEAALQNCFEKASRANTAQIWRKCKRLIIDEISMVDADFFEKIEAVARYIRKNDKPFGGIQLILCGDFFQLPPVDRQENRPKPGQYSQDNDVGPRVRFCFESKVWQECIQASYELTIVHRQKDQEFVGILNSIRIGRVTNEITARLQKTASQRIETEGILATQLCSHTSEVDAINRAKLEAIQSEAKTFEAKDSDPYSAKQLDQAVQAPAKLTLKIGAQVMLLKNYNIAEGLVNGARGVVMNFVQGLPLVKFKRRELVVRSEKWSVKTASGMVLTRTQLPLKLAWAFSIHKSQGLTLDCVELSLAKVFEAGQAYVALSRAQSLDSIRVLDFDLKQVWANPKVLEYYRNLRRQIANENLMMPVAVKPKAGQKGPNLKKSLSAMGLSKAVMSKPLMTIK
ncbi:ATP-dependent DNA helicase PIF1 [Anopheles ziemanni]|uniref:ATP-dependent DNA helicase PIF1 n=1 Tax=Anopheles coustani TaxID=139045 RepID=UPI0026586018|nr:ATP-dependent DNA helicase PIF1 [Anopheles coustani]XP_058168746.1 ATP-dependent DNA helicase PIF1 [Anopheles ziemanni]